MKQAIRETPYCIKNWNSPYNSCLQTPHTKFVQTTGNELEIDDRQFEKADSRFSAKQTRLQNTVSIAHYWHKIKHY